MLISMHTIIAIYTNVLKINGIHLRLELLGLVLVASAALGGGHDPRFLDLQAAHLKRPCPP